MIVNFFLLQGNPFSAPSILHIISMERGNGRSNYCGLHNLTSAQLKAASGWLMGFSVGFHKVAS